VSHPHFIYLLFLFLSSSSSSQQQPPLLFAFSPMINPLQFTLSQDENYRKYRQLCEASDESDESDESESDSDAALRRLHDRGQTIQHDWFGKWVGAMARVAKPGGAIIVEQVAVPYCDCYVDWGGVSHAFWKEAVTQNTYGWNIDPESLVIELDTMHKKRYHVVMVKKEEKEEEKDVSMTES
jgi:hypothetical protein